MCVSLIGKQRGLSETKLLVKILNINSTFAVSANVEPHQLLMLLHLQRFDYKRRTPD